jgi:hypothetical protein
MRCWRRLTIWQEGSVTPGESEAKVIVRDVYGAKIPVFIVKEVEDVEKMEEADKKH